MDGADELVAKTVIEMMEVPLDDAIYAGLSGAKLTLEVRDFGKPERTLVIRWWAEGTVYTAMVGYDSFMGELDAMRSRMLPGDWDDALAALIGGGSDG